MAGDGAYPNLWRRYVSTGNFHNARGHIANIASDLTNLQHQIDLAEGSRRAVEKAAGATRGYLSSLGATKLSGDTDLRDAAMTAIDEMEVALRGATGRYD